MSRDITQGLPRIEEVFEVRTPKFEASMAPYAGKISVSEENDSRKVFLVGKEGAAEFDVPVGRTILVKDGAKVEVGQPLTEGYLDPKKMIAAKGVMLTQKYLVNEILKAYSSQGVSLDDVHLEVIVRQMFTKVRITDPGGTRFIPEEVVTKIQLAQENSSLPKGSKKATGERVLLGITKSSLRTDSWLSAASFMETTRILTEAAASGKEDKLFGLKENVIIGRLIPTGERSKMKENKK
jgi:DNA-directed RNA polymerase subunit beta'